MGDVELGKLPIQKGQVQAPQIIEHVVVLKAMEHAPQMAVKAMGSMDLFNDHKDAIMRCLSMAKGADKFEEYLRGKVSFPPTQSALYKFFKDLERLRDAEIGFDLAGAALSRQDAEGARREFRKALDQYNEVAKKYNMREMSEKDGWAKVTKGLKISSPGAREAIRQTIELVRREQQDEERRRKEREKAQVEEKRRMPKPSPNTKQGE